MNQIMTVSEVAKALQMSVSTIYKYSEKGVLPSFKIGKNLRFLEKEINDYIQKNILEQRNQNEKFWKF